MDILSTRWLVLQVEPTRWDDLVRQSAALLERDGLVTADYVQAIFDSMERNGDYMVVAPRVLLAHARPEMSALGTGLSLITAREDVPLRGNPELPIRLFFTFAATDSSSHLDLLARLAEVLTDQSAFGELVDSADRARVLHLLNSGAR